MDLSDLSLFSLLVFTSALFSLLFSFLNRLTLPEDSSVAYWNLINCEIGELEMTDSQYERLNACVFKNVSFDEEHLKELRRKGPVRVENGKVWSEDFN